MSRLLRPVRSWLRLIRSIDRTARPYLFAAHVAGLTAAASTFGLLVAAVPLKVTPWVTAHLGGLRLRAAAWLNQATAGDQLMTVVGMVAVPALMLFVIFAIVDG